MKNVLFGSLFIIAFLIPVAYSAFQNPQEVNVGASLPQTPAGFETSLAAPITSSATTMTLTANSTRGGTALSGYNCFSIDVGSAQAEYVCGTVSGTTVSSLTRGIDDVTGTTTNATLQFSHRRGASVQVTDFPAIQIMRAQNNGQDTFPNALVYASTVCTAGSSNTTICDKAYVDSTANAGASDANETTKGIGELATQSEAASSTSLGGTSARLLLPASMATDTPNTLTRPSRVLMSDMTGYLKQGWINLTEAFTFAKLTTTATTTIPASSVVVNPLVLNSVAYKFPVSNGASSTSLMNDGSGNLVWGQNWTLVTSTTTAITQGSVYATTTAYRNYRIYAAFTLDNASNAFSLRFNNDVGATYGYSRSVDNAASTKSSADATGIQITNGTTSPIFMVIDIENTTAKRKLVSAQGSASSATALAPASYEASGVWNNTSAQITTLEFTTGDPATTKITSGATFFIYGAN